MHRRTAADERSAAARTATSLTIDTISTEITVIGNPVGTDNDVCELMTFAAQGKVRLHTSGYPLERFQDAIDDLEAGRAAAAPFSSPDKET